MIDRFERRLNADLSKFTVSGTVYALIQCYLKSGSKLFNDYRGTEASEIAKEYDQLAAEVGKNKFYYTYLQRHTKDDDYFEENFGEYRFNQEWTYEYGRQNFEELSKRIKDFWLTKPSWKKQTSTDINDIISSSISCEEKKRFIKKLLDSKSGNRGINFEVMTFSILREYFKSFGFNLKRFSTTLANDGGMDYLCENGFFQVTVAPTAKKIGDDLQKLSDIQRILVVLSRRRNDKFINRDNVVEIIDYDDITNHFLGWLYNRDKSRGSAYHLDNILKTALREYDRE